MAVRSYISGATEYDVRVNPAGIVTARISNHVMTITPHAAGQTTVQVQGENDDGTSPWLQVSVTVTEPPPPPGPELSIADASVIEGNSGSTTLAFRLTLSAASTQRVRAWTRTLSGTAAAGSDFENRSGWVTFPPGRTWQDFEVRVYGDTEVEQDERFQVSVERVEHATLVDGVATGTIVNDDAQPPPPSNRPPALTKPFDDIDISPGYSWDTGVLSAYFSDPDGDVLTYTASSSRPNVARVSRPSPLYGVTVSGGETEGTTEVTVTATDPGGLFVSDTFEVENIRHPLPVRIKPIPDQVFAHDDRTPREYILSEYFSGATSYDLGSSPSAVAVTISDHMMKITPVSAGSGTVVIYAVGVRWGDRVRASFKVTVEARPIHLPPLQFSSPSAQPKTVHLSWYVRNATRYEIKMDPTGIVAAWIDTHGGNEHDLIVLPKASGETIVTIRASNASGWLDLRMHVRVG